MLLLNMCNKLELLVLFVCVGRLVNFFSAWVGQKNLLYCSLLMGISTLPTLWIVCWGLLITGVNQVKKKKFIFKKTIIFRHVVFLESFLLYLLLCRILLKTFLQIKCTINMCIEQIKSIKRLTMKWYQKLIMIMNNQKLIMI